MKGRSGLGRYVDLYMDGKLELDPLITHRLELADIDEGFRRMQDGSALRSVVIFE